MAVGNFSAVGNLSRRSLEPELMDGQSIEFHTLRRCLRELERINCWTLSYRLTLAWLDRVRAAHRPRSLVLLDIGSGHGDMLRRIWCWARARQVPIELIGVDLNPHAVAAAEQATPREAPIRYITADVLELPDEPVDVIVSAMFAHHLDDERLVRFLRWMEQSARLGWLVNDLHRHRLPFLVARWAPRLLRMSPLVRHDASLSVARSFVRADWERLLREAQLAPEDMAIAWHFPFRYAVARIRPPCPAS